MSQNADLMNDYGPILRGFCSALRDPEHYNFLSDIFEFMNAVQFDLEGAGNKSPTYFLERVYKSKTLGNIWMQVTILYERKYAPINQVPGNDIDKSVNEYQFDELISHLHTLYPPTHGGPSEDILNFAAFFKNRPASAVESDFHACKEHLRVACYKLGNYFSKKEEKIHETNPMDAIEMRMARLDKINALFARASASFMSGVSKTMMDLMTDPGRHKRLPFYAGKDHSSLDWKSRGWHGKGLNVIIGGTSSGKTHFMSSYAENLIYQTWLKNRPFENEEAGAEYHPYPTIWGYILEDGIDEYNKRILCKFCNRRDVQEAYGLHRMTLFDLTELLVSSNPQDKNIKDNVLGISSIILENCRWVRSPTDPQEMLNFSTVSMLQMFHQEIEHTGVRPELIIIDYFNHLRLSRSDSSGNIPKDLSTIAHLLDEWGDQHNTPILTAVQSTINGIIAARDMVFPEFEALSESKSIAHHARLVLSLMPFDSYDEKGNKKNWMGLKILKNRGALKDLIYVCGNDFAINTTLIDSKEYEEKEWQIYKNKIIETKAVLFGEAASSGFGKGGPNRGGGGGGGFGGNKGGAPARAARPEGPAANSPSLATAASSDSGSID